MPRSVSEAKSVHCGEVNADHRRLCPKKFKQSSSIFATHEVNALTEQSSSLDENALISSVEFVLMQTATTEVKNPTILEARLSDFC